MSATTKSRRLLDGMAGFAVLTNRFSFLRLVIIVVAAETASRVNVPDVIGVGSEGDAHLGKDTPPEEVLHGRDGSLDL